MSELDWKLVFEKRFDKKIQQSGNHAYRLMHPVTIRVDGQDISVPKGSLFVFEQHGLVVVRERDDSPDKHHIALKSISLVTFENETSTGAWEKLGSQP